MGRLKVGIAQISPVWLNKLETLNKITEILDQAGKADVELVTLGEALLPGYPFWTSLTDGTQWDSSVQKELHAHYLSNSIQVEKGELDTVCDLARKYSMAIYLGIIERAVDRGGHSLYASLVYIDATGAIKSVHRKLQPTYDERLTWSPGDGNGLQVHDLHDFRVGGLNCWENWMPLPRAGLYAQGENLHVAVWPGSDHNTRDITRFIAKESRSYVISASALMNRSNFPSDTPHLKTILKECPETLTNGGSCIAGPDGEFIVEPVIGKEGLITAELDIQRVYQERQNFDPSGHYSRPDVTRLTLNRERQSILHFENL